MTWHASYALPISTLRFSNPTSLCLPSVFDTASFLYEMFRKQSAEHVSREEYRGVFFLAGPVAETFVYVGILVHPAKQKHNELKTAARHGAAAAVRPTERVGGRCRQMMARRIATIQLHLDQVERERRKG